MDCKDNEKDLNFQFQVSEISILFTFLLSIVLCTQESNLEEDVLEIPTNQIMETTTKKYKNTINKSEYRIHM